MSTRNRAEYLDGTIRSILEQDMPDFELVVGDNCSQDDTWDILQSLAKQDSRLNCFRNEEDMGAAAGHNKALSRATAPLFIFAGDDDPWHKDRLSRLLDLRGTGGMVSCVYSDWLRIGPRDEVLESEAQRLSRKQPPLSTASLGGMVKQCRAPDFKMALGLIPRDLFPGGMALMPLHKGVGAYSDGPMVFRMLCRGEVKYLPTPTFSKREGHGWQYSGHRSENPQDYLLHLQAYCWFWAKAREEMEGAAMAPMRKKICLYAADKGFAKVSFKIARQFEEKVPNGGDEKAAFFAEMKKFIRDKKLGFAERPLWMAESVWPLVRGPMRSLGLSK